MHSEATINPEQKIPKPVCRITLPLTTFLPAIALAKAVHIHNIDHIFQPCLI